MSRVRSDGFQFHPPLPPGSASSSAAPPLPPGTPPSTPPIPKGTPPPTPPTHGSPSTHARGLPEGEESEDGLSLEELEQQQRLLWAALEKTDTTTSSDSETPVPSSPSVVTSLRLDSEEDAEKTEDSSHACEVESMPSSPNVCEEERMDEREKHAIDVQAEMSDITVLDEVHQEDSNHEATNGAPDSPQINTREEEPAVNKVTLVPHRSRFAAGIIPFEDTPEFTEVAEATGVYLKIRDLLKGSPRSQAQNKK